jgi:hypothetical protein
VLQLRELHPLYPAADGRVHGQARGLQQRYLQRYALPRLVLRLMIIPFVQEAKSLLRGKCEKLRVTVENRFFRLYNGQV